MPIYFFKFSNLLFPRLRLHVVDQKAKKKLLKHTGKFSFNDFSKDNYKVIIKR